MNTRMFVLFVVWPLLAAALGVALAMVTGSSSDIPTVGRVEYLATCFDGGKIIFERDGYMLDGDGRFYAGTNVYVLPTGSCLLEILP
jgi:hypothetical protein